MLLLSTQLRPQLSTQLRPQLSPHCPYSFSYINSKVTVIAIALPLISVNNHWKEWHKKCTKTRVIANNFCPFFPGKCQSEWDTKCEQRCGERERQWEGSKKRLALLSTADTYMTGWIIQSTVCSVRSHSQCLSVLCCALSALTLSFDGLLLCYRFAGVM